MSDFSTRISIEAPADEVFSFVTDFDNMPQYLPTLRRATPAGEGHVRMEGEVNGHPYDSTGWYQIHELNRTMLWGAKGANDYTGDLEVMDQGEFCQLTINLKYVDLPNVSVEDRTKLKAHEPQIQQGLDEAGRKVKDSCEKASLHMADKRKGYLT
jgi:hypothetical protein